MLTKSDLLQIRKIIREEVETESKNTRDSIEHETRTANLHVRNEIHELADRLKNVEVRLSSVEKELKKASKDIRKLQKDISVAIEVFNVEDTKIAKRVTKLEDHLQI